MIHNHEISNRNLHPMMQAQLLMAVNLAEQIGPLPADSLNGVWVRVTAPKVTDTPARKEGVDFLPGFAPGLHFGLMTVNRYVDNPDNRRKDRVNAVYFKIKDFARGNGLKPYGWTNLRPSQLTGFVVTGVMIPEVEAEMATKALAEAASQTPSGV